MLPAKNMLNSLLEKNNNQTEKEYNDYNDDHDFSKVLEFCNGNTVHKNVIRYSDGQETVFSFESNGKEENESL